MNKLFKGLLVGMVLLAALSLVACGEKKEESNGKQAVTAVTVQLNWTDDNEWSGFYMAQEKGHYTKEGLAVTLRTVFGEDGAFLDPIEEVLAGRAQFGVADATTILTARAAGKPVVAVATVYQRHPLALTSLASSNINTPQDLIGKTIHISGVSQVLFRAFLASQGLDPEQMTIVERTDYTTASLINGDADVIDAWITNETVHLDIEGIPYNTLLVSDYGLDLYPAVIFTTDDLVKNQPKLMERMLRATLKGMQDAVDDPEKVIDILMQRDSTLDRQVQSLGMRKSLPLIVPAGSKPGMMSEAVWNDTIAILVEQGLLTSADQAAGAYTLTFLNTIYKP